MTMADENRTLGNPENTGFEVAVIGMAGRFPGAGNITEFWNNLINGLEATAFSSEDELAEAGIDRAVFNHPRYIKAGMGLEKVEYFDASFFGYTPAEAEIADPQVRIFHEITWEVLEEAGYDPDRFNGLIGVYAGAGHNHYWEGLCTLAGKAGDVGVMTFNQLVDKDFFTLRISYTLNLIGPSYSVFTACSTSLVAIHLACQALLNGECDIALAGGVTVLLPGSRGYMYEEGMIRSPDGHCRAFDARARGTMGGSGAGIVALKLLEDAVQDRDNIQAVVKSSAINNDGMRKGAFTAPAQEGQAEVIRAALQAGHVEPESIGYIETHGTGTSLGDPIEIEAIKLAFDTARTGYCAIGSVKTNVGHLDTAAGVAGFIKTVLALKHKLIPASLHFETANPEIDFINSPFYVNTGLSQWKRENGPLRAGVSSFGIGGTNAHVVLEEWPGTPVEIELEEEKQTREHQLILLSSKTETALAQMTRNLARHLEENRGINLADAAYTLQVGRKVFPCRGITGGSNVEEVIGRLNTLESGEVSTYCGQDDEPGIVFMFPGQGAQYVNMGLDLYRTEPVFRQEIDRCFEILDTLVDFDIKGILYPQDPENRTGDTGDGTAVSGGNTPVSAGTPVLSRIDRTEVAQPLLFVLEYALAKLLIKWGIRPRAMIGHSIGEYTAACLSGVFSLEDALKLVVLRGRLMQGMPGGAMLSAAISAEELKPLLETNREISLAAVNAPFICVVSGSHLAVDAFARQLQQREVETRILHTSHAFHSPMMDPILTEFAQQVKTITLKQPRIPYISNVTGQEIEAGQAMDPGYWAEHLRKPVYFSDGIAGLLTEKPCIFLEVGPGKALRSFVMQQIEQRPNQAVIHLIRHPKEQVADHVFLLNKIGHIWLLGKNPDWAAFYGPEKRQRISLPTYPFERQKYWVEADFSRLFTGGSRGQGSRDFADWFSIPSWKRLAVLPPDRRSQPEKCRWLVLGQETGITHLWVERLEKEGHDVVTVIPGSRFKRLAAGRFRVNPAQASDYMELFQELDSTRQLPDRIVHFWGVGQEGAVTPEPSFTRFDRAQELGFYSLLYLVKAVVRAAAGSSVGAQGQQEQQGIDLTVVTANMQEVTQEETIYPEKATITGLIKVIPQEHPGIRCRSIDLALPGTGAAPAWSETVMEQLWTEFSIDTDKKAMEPVLAFRGHHRWVQVFEPVHLEELPDSSLPLQEKGVYLLTGGLGDIALVYSRYLAEQFKARLILTDLARFPDRENWDEWQTAHGETDTINQKIEKVKELESLGAEVLIFSADSADFEQMQTVLRESETRFGKINGVVHAAGIIKGKSFSPVQTLEPSECQRQFRAKAYGLYVIEELFKHHPLDFVLLLSSISAVLGGLQFGAYAAANSFMDAYASWRSLPGRTGKRSSTAWISVNWDGMEPGHTVAGFKRALMLSIGGINRVAVSNGGDLQGRIRRWVKLESTKGEAVSKKSLKEQKPRIPRPAFLKPYAAPHTPTQETLAGIWRKIFGFDQIGIDDDFFQLGGDSLKAVTVIAIIYKQLHTEIPLAEFFNRPTIHELAEYIERAEKSHFIAIPAAEKKDYHVLTPPQMRMYILQQLESENTGYNQTLSRVLEGDIDGKRLEATFNLLIRRHESLRTSFAMMGNQVIQRVHDRVDFEIAYYPSSLTADQVIRQLVRPFDLTQAPLLRVGIVQLGEKSHLLLTDMHHIIWDAISYNVLINDFAALYAGRELPALRIHYKDYAEWKHIKIRENTLKKQEMFWLKELSGEIPVVNLPLDFKRPAVQSFEGNTVKIGMEEQETARLNQLALKEKTTLYMVLLAITNILLAKICSQEEIVMGTPVAGRDHADLEKVIGLFVNTLVMRNYPVREKSFLEFLKDVKARTLNAFENQDYPFEELVEQLDVNRDASRNPLFDIMFVLQNAGEKAAPSAAAPSAPATPVTPASPATPARGGFRVSYYDYVADIAKFDLTVTFLESGKNLSMALEYCTKLFTRETILRIIGFFKKIVSAVLEDPGKKLTDLDLVAAEEKQRLLYEFNDPQVGYPEGKTIHELFIRQVQQVPDRVALVGNSALAAFPADQDGYSEKALITYSQLDRNSQHLAQLLIEKGVGPDTIVGIIVEPCLEMMTAILAILKAGGAYLPINPEYPEERQNYILADSKVRFLVKNSKNFSNSNSGEGVEIIPIDDQTMFSSSSSSSSHLLNFSTSGSSNLAYIIYTSGTTGRPKGALINHRNVVRLMFNDKFQFDFHDRDVWTLFHSYCFDFSVWEMYGALLYGGKLVIISRMAARDTLRYLEILQEEAVTVLNQTPSAFYHLMNEALKAGTASRPLTLRYVIFGGEALNPGQLKTWQETYPHTRLVNMYGITETTVHVTYKELAARDLEAGKSNIGKPIPTLSAYVMDRDFNLLPIGIPGELCVGGLGLGPGYLNRVQLTADKFIKNPLQPNQRLYRSGDLVKLLPDGEMEYLGRIDHQVKIRGFRIELGEIQGHLLKHEAIDQCIVVDRGEGAEKSLCAYFTLHPSGPAGGQQDEASTPDSVQPPGTRELREFLARQLPDYMIPAYFVHLEQIPLTVNGKVDRKALPVPESEIIGEDYAAPRTGIERELIAIWAEILGIAGENIGVNTSFFELGGHSLRATILAARIRKQFDVKLPLTTIFSSPFIKELAEFIRDAHQTIYEDIQPMEKREYYPQSSAQKRLFFLDQFEDIGISYNIPYIFSIYGEIAVARYEAAFKALIQRHEALRTSFVIVDGEPVQVVHDRVDFSIEILPGLHEDNLDNRQGVQDRIKEFVRPFDLAGAPLLRAGLLRLAEGEHLLLFDMHHIIGDGTSMTILTRDFMQCYAGSPLPGLRVQYKDFSLWQNHLFAGEEIKSQEAYWLSLYGDTASIPVLNLPTDYPRQQVFDFDGAVYPFKLEASISRGFKELAGQCGATLYMNLLAVFNVLLHKYSGQEDVIVGTGIAGRPHHDLEHIIGMFVNTLAMRNYPQPDKSYRDFLLEVKDNCVKAFENQDMQFEELVNLINLDRTAMKNPIFSVELNVHNYERPAPGKQTKEETTGNNRITHYAFENTTSKFDLILFASETGDEISFTLEYSTGLFKSSTIEKMAERYLNVIQQVVNNNEIQIKDIKISHDLLVARPAEISAELQL